MRTFLVFLLGLPLVGSAQEITSTLHDSSKLLASYSFDVPGESDEKYVQNLLSYLDASSRRDAKYAFKCWIELVSPNSKGEPSYRDFIHAVDSKRGCDRKVMVFGESLIPRWRLWARLASKAKNGTLPFR